MMKDSAMSLASPLGCAGLFSVISVLFNGVLFFNSWRRSGSPSVELQPPTFPSSPEHGVSFPFSNVVLVESRFVTFSQTSPWRAMSATVIEGVGQVPGMQSSGLVLHDGLILTSSEMATDVMMITVQRQSSSEKFQAEVVAVAKEVGLSLLRVSDKAFETSSDFVKIEVAESAVTSLPELGHTVTVAGYPPDGVSGVSCMESFVSRIYVQGSSGRNDPFPVPLLSLYPEPDKSTVLGPVFDTHTGGLIGFIRSGSSVVPLRSVATFVETVAKQGNWPGLGTLGMVHRTMQAAGLRKYWDLNQDDVGVQIKSVSPLSPLKDKVKKGDILVAIDGQPVHASGAIMYNKVALPFQALLGDKPPGSTNRLRFQRAERAAVGYKKIDEFDVNVVFKPPPNHDKKKEKPKKPVDATQQSGGTNGTKDSKEAPPMPQPKQPPFFMVGGLIWGVLTKDLVVQAAVTGEIAVTESTLVEALIGWPKQPPNETIVLLQGIEHPCNEFYEKRLMRVLTSFNGEPVQNLTTFLKKVGMVLQDPKQRYLQFGFAPINDEAMSSSDPDDPDLVLDKELCLTTDLQLAMNMGMTNPASNELAIDYKKYILGPLVEKVRTQEAEMKKQMMDQMNMLGKAKTKADPILVSLYRKLAASNKPEDQAQAAALVKARPELQTAELDEDSQKKDDPGAAAKSAKMDELIRPMQPKNRNGDLPWSNVVKLVRTFAKQDYLHPWQMSGELPDLCSAVITNVSARQILTSADCAEQATTIDVLREDMPVPVPARVVELAHDINVAWITTDVDSFWESKSIQQELHIASELPRLAEDVRLLGYPVTGNSVTVTEGVVSRFDGTQLNKLEAGKRNTPDEAIVIQVDAAINEGNGGGPAFNFEGELVGLAFGSLKSGNGIGYLIPNILLKNFVGEVRQNSGDSDDDTLKARWQAVPETGIMTRHVENQGLKHYFGLKPGETGVQIRTIAPMSPLFGKLQKGDILVGVDGKQVNGDGNVIYTVGSNNFTLPFATEITSKPRGQPTQIEVLRVNLSANEPVKLSFSVQFEPVPPLAARFDDAPLRPKGREYFAAVPSYFIVGGLVWGVASMPVFEKAQVPWSLKKQALHRWRSPGKDGNSEQVVVLLSNLAHGCTTHYDLSGPMRSLEFFNGEKVNNLEHLIRLVGAAESQNEEFMRFTFSPMADKDFAGDEFDPDIVLLRSQCNGADAELLETLFIPSRCSSDVQAICDRSFSPHNGTHSGTGGNAAASRSLRAQSGSLMQQSEMLDGTIGKRRNAHLFEESTSLQAQFSKHAWSTVPVLDSWMPDPTPIVARLDGAWGGTSGFKESMPQQSVAWGSQWSSSHLPF